MLLAAPPYDVGLPAADSDTATAGGGSSAAVAVSDTLVDWRLVVRPPLTLQNLLPLPARYIVWEAAAAGGQMRLRTRGSVGPGEAAPVYAADMRKLVRG